MKKKGLFIAFEGADGVGKSTIINKIIPILMKQNNFTDYVYFHWKPIKKGMSINHIPSSPSQDPRGKSPRNVLLSLVFLSYHYLCYLYGYFFILKPQIKKNRLIIADRYTYDIFLDPKRFRLILPKWILKLFIKLTPQPHTTVALVAAPEVIISRKPELSKTEIEQYQDLLTNHNLIKRLIIQNAEATPNEIVCELMEKLKKL
jgi:thymidylate kinase